MDEYRRLHLPEILQQKAISQSFRWDVARRDLEDAAAEIIRLREQLKPFEQDYDRGDGTQVVADL